MQTPERQALPTAKYAEYAKVRSCAWVSAGGKMDREDDYWTDDLCGSARFGSEEYT